MLKTRKISYFKTERKKKGIYGKEEGRREGRRGGKEGEKHEMKTLDFAQLHSSHMLVM